MRRLASTVGLALLAVLAAITPSGAQQHWQVQNNPRYGFSLAYPAPLFALERTSEAGDGHIFTAPSQGARLLAGVIINEDRHTPASYFDYIATTSYAGSTITYRRIGPTWFAISGEQDGRVFYEKVQFSCNGALISSFAVVYPAASQRVINPVIERMENSFRSASNCAAGKLPPPAG
jgi:hypothetical protein